MKIHTVRSPFLSRKGQFEEDKKTLCIGLSVQALKCNELFRCYLGSNRKTYYEIEPARALEVAREHNSFWTNARGVDVAIVPLKEFAVHKSQWSAEEYETKEVKRAVINQAIQERLYK